MKSGLLLCLAVLFPVLWTACSEDGKARAIVSLEKSIESDLGREIRISANDAMRYDITSFVVKPGEQITVIFFNAGRMPKAAMGHNWVLLKAGTNLREFAGEGAMYGDTDFINPETRDLVLAATAMLGPREISKVTFIAPEEPGNYPYVCTFPGHLAAGMKGTMTVQFESGEASRLLTVEE
jgi:azurin